MRSKTYKGLETHLEPRVQCSFIVCTPFVFGTVNGIISLVE